MTAQATNPAPATMAITRPAMKIWAATDGPAESDEERSRATATATGATSRQAASAASTPRTIGSLFNQAAPVARAAWRVSVYCWKATALPSSTRQTCANWASIAFPLALNVPQ